MAITAIVHIVGEDAFMADLDEMPNPTHTFLMLRNMRKKDGKQLTYLSDDASAFLYAWTRITFIELLGDVAGVPSPTKAAAPQGTTVLGFFRDDDR